MNITRRNFIKSQAAAAAAAAAGITLPAATTNAQGIVDDVRWDKAACRSCGTGCGALIGTKKGKGVRT